MPLPQRCCEWHKFVHREMQLPVRMGPVRLPHECAELLPAVLGFDCSSDLPGRDPRAAHRAACNRDALPHVLNPQHVEAPTSQGENNSAGRDVVHEKEQASRD